MDVMKKDLFLFPFDKEYNFDKVIGKETCPLLIEELKRFKEIKSN